MYWYQVSLLHLSEEDPIKFDWLADIAQTGVVAFNDKARHVQEFYNSITRPNLLENQLDRFIQKLAAFVSADGIVCADAVKEICGEKKMPSIADVEAFMTLAFYETEFKYAINTFNVAKTREGELLFGMLEPHLHYYAIGSTRALPNFLGHLDMNVELGQLYRMVPMETATIVLYHLETRQTPKLPMHVRTRLVDFGIASQKRDSVQYGPGAPGVEYDFDTCALFETTPDQLEKRQLEAHVDDENLRVIPELTDEVHEGCKCQLGGAMRRYTKKKDGRTLTHCYNRAFIRFPFDDKDYVYRVIKSIRGKNKPERKFTDVLRQLPEYEDEFRDFCDNFITAIENGDSDISQDRILQTVEEVILNSSDPGKTRITLVAFCLWVFDPQTTQQILLMRKEGKSGKNAWTLDPHKMPFKPRNVVDLTLRYISELAKPFVLTMATHFLGSIVAFAWRKPWISELLLCDIARRIDPPSEMRPVAGVIMHVVKETFRDEIVRMVQTSAGYENRQLNVDASLRALSKLVSIHNKLLKSGVDDAWNWLLTQENEFSTRIRPQPINDPVTVHKKIHEAISDSAAMAKNGIPEMYPGPAADGRYMMMFSIDVTFENYQGELYRVVRLCHIHELLGGSSSGSDDYAVSGLFAAKKFVLSRIAQKRVAAIMLKQDDGDTNDGGDDNNDGGDEVIRRNFIFKII